MIGMYVYGSFGWDRAVPRKYKGWTISLMSVSICAPVICLINRATRRKNEIHLMIFVYRVTDNNNNL